MAVRTSDQETLVVAPARPNEASRRRKRCAGFRFRPTYLAQSLFHQMTKGDPLRFCASAGFLKEKIAVCPRWFS